MMKKFVWLLVLVLGGLTSVSAQTQVAVYVDGAINDYCKNLIETKAVERILKTKQYTAVERTQDFLKAMTKEHDYQLSGEVDEEQIAKLGKRFGAHYVVAIVASESDGDGSLSAKMIDVTTGTIVKAVNTHRKVSSNDDWVAMGNNVIYRLFTQK